MFKQAGFAAAAMAATLAAAPAPAAVIVTFNEVGSNVVGSFSGSLDLPFLAGLFEINEVTLYAAIDVFVTRGALTTAPLDIYLASGPTPGTFGFDNGTGVFTTSGDSATGDALGVFGSSGVVGVPSNYVSGAALAGTFTFLNQSFVTMSVLPGTYTYTLYNSSTNLYDGDTVTLQFGPEATSVPVAATLPLMLGALGGVAVAARRMRQCDGDPC